MSTIQEHYERIVALKESRPELDGLTSYSATAVWRVWCWLAATVAWMNGLALEKHQAEIEQKLASRQHRTLPWYHRILLEFQYGDSIEWNGLQYGYLDTTSSAAEQKRIVRYATVSLVNGQIQLKCAKVEDEQPIPLQPAEKQALQAYVEKLSAPGANFTVISLPADSLRLDVTIYYNPETINASGGLISTPTEFPVDEAVNQFIKALPFDGRMNTMRLIDAIQAAEGVQDVELVAIEWKYGFLPYTDAGREIVPAAGHLKLDLAASTITYTPYV